MLCQEEPRALGKVWKVLELGEMTRGFFRFTCVPIRQSQHSQWLCHLQQCPGMADSLAVSVWPLGPLPLSPSALHGPGEPAIAPDFSSGQVLSGFGQTKNRQQSTGKSS